MKVGDTVYIGRYMSVIECVEIIFLHGEQFVGKSENGLRIFYETDVMNDAEMKKSQIALLQENISKVAKKVQDIDALMISYDALAVAVSQKNGEQSPLTQEQIALRTFASFIRAAGGDVTKSP